MTKAAALAAAGCPPGTVVVADEQTAGQGRHGHSWHSEKGAGLYLSQVLRLDLATDALPAVTLALGLATAEAIASTAGVCCDLRWPNDVLIDTRKCAGILVRVQDGVLITGIGINVNHSSFPSELQKIATSLRIVTGREHDREALLEAVLSAVDEHLEMLCIRGKEEVFRAFSRTSSYVSGRRVVVDQEGGRIEGTTDGLDAHGFLLLKQDNGQRSLIVAGGVRPACS